MAKKFEVADRSGTPRDSFSIMHTATSSTIYGKYRVSDTGKKFLETPQSLKVLFPFIDPFEAKQKSDVSRTEQTPGEERHSPSTKNKKRNEC